MLSEFTSVDAMPIFLPDESVQHFPPTAPGLREAYLPGPVETLDSSVVPSYVDPILVSQSWYELDYWHETALSQSDRLSQSDERTGNTLLAPLSTDELWHEAGQALAEFERSPDFEQALSLSFGDRTDSSQISDLIQQFIEGETLPRIQVLSENLLLAKGAYAAETDTIYLSKELFDRPQELLRTFLEELGHFFDDQINPVDAPGDEGALFASQVLGDQLSAVEVEWLKAEDDRALLSIGDEILTVEQAALEGSFTVDTTGEVIVEFMADGGGYEGQLAVFSLDGIEDLSLGSAEFIQEAARRALSGSQGYVVIDDATEGASLSGNLRERDRNSGPKVGPKRISWTAGTTIAIMLVPDGTVQQVFDNPEAEGSLRPLFSLPDANPRGRIHLGQIRPGLFAMEDKRFDQGSDADFNDIVFRLEGVTGAINAVGALVDQSQLWLDTPLGQQLLQPPILNPGVPTADPVPVPRGPLPQIVVGSDNPVLPPINPDALQVVIPNDVAQFTASSSEADIAASGAASLTFGTQTIYIGTNQVSANNQNPIIVSFDSTNPANNWVRTDYEVTGADGRGLGLAWDGNNLYAVFSVDGTQGSASEDFRRAASDADQAWLRSYGAGGGAKVSVLGRIDATDGELLDAAYLSAVLSSGKSNTLNVTGLSVSDLGNLVVEADSYFSPRRPDGTAMTQRNARNSPFAYTVEITKNLKRVISTAAPGWS